MNANRSYQPHRPVNYRHRMMFHTSLNTANTAKQESSIHPRQHMLAVLLRGLQNLSFAFVWLSVSLASDASAESQGQPASGDRHPTSSPSFVHDIRPILSNKCYHCHGPDEEYRAADLRLDTPEGVLAAFAEGDLSESLAWERINSDDPDEVMPPPEMHKPITSAERDLLEAWIRDGSRWSPHWAFMPPKKVHPPSAASGSNPIDAFVRHRLKEDGLAPNPPSTKEKLIRRAKLDLHGLPPTHEELDAFLNDPEPHAWERLLDRLLESPLYGERMAVAWLDGARYADTNGYQNDFGRTMWPWRDWVVRSFNDNQPFDRFAVEQLAGDLLPNPTKDQLLATAFNRNNRTVTEAGSIAEEWRVENIVDRVETTSAVFLGLTMGCARCHDHKYDPISQQEFFEFYAFFNSTDELGVYREVRGNVGPTVDCPDDQQLARLADLKNLISEAKDRIEVQRLPAQDGAKDWIRAGSSTTKPAAVAAANLDGKTVSAVVGGERILSPVNEKNHPRSAQAFLDGVARFEGRHRLAYEDFYAPEIDRAFTFSAWVKREGTGAVLSKMNVRNAHRGYDWLINEKGRLTIHMINHWPDNAIKVISAEPVPQELWTLITVSYDGSGGAEGLTVHFDGARQEIKIDKNSLSESIETDQPFRIGSRSHGSNFQGEIGRLRIFDHVLSDCEIRSLIDHDLRESSLSERIAGSENDASESATLEVDDEWLRHYARIDTSRKARNFARAIEDLALLEEQRDELLRRIPTCMVMKELPEPRTTYVLKRGEYDKPDKDRTAKPALPSFLGVPLEGRRDRLALANWIVSRENPLTARVVMNRLWAQLFGVGIVKSEENFGLQSDPPSHPELLDWLAVEFMESGWDTQHMIRLIMSSETYRQSADASPDAFAADPDNRLLARGPRKRLSAEFIRDNALAVSGLLESKIGGPPVRPYQPEGLWTELAGGASDGPYTLSKGRDLYRRSLYTIRKRTVPHPTLATFDAPSFEMCVVKRSTTNTPMQALALLNDTTYVEAARAFGEQMLRRGGENDKARVAFGFRSVTSRNPSTEELRLLVAAVQKYRLAYESNRDAADDLLSVGASKADASLDPAEAAAYTSLGGVLLNLDETITVD